MQCLGSDFLQDVFHVPQLQCLASASRAAFRVKKGPALPCGAASSLMQRQALHQYAFVMRDACVLAASSVQKVLSPFVGIMHHRPFNSPPPQVDKVTGEELEIAIAGRDTTLIVDFFAVSTLSSDCGFTYCFQLVRSAAFPHPTSSFHSKALCSHNSILQLYTLGIIHSTYFPPCLAFQMFCICHVHSRPISAKSTKRTFSTRVSACGIRQS